MYYAAKRLHYKLATRITNSKCFQRNEHRYAALSFATIVTISIHFAVSHSPDSLHTNLTEQGC
jgi:hypothetical protein